MMAAGGEAQPPTTAAKAFSRPRRPPGRFRGSRAHEQRQAEEAQAIEVAEVVESHGEVDEEPQSVEVEVDGLTIEDDFEDDMLPREIVPLRRLADTEELSENARLRRELAEVRHQLRNRLERSREEAEFWRRNVLELGLKLAAESAGEAAGGAVASNASPSVIAAAQTLQRGQGELAQLQMQRQAAERRKAELEVQAREARAAAQREAQVSAKLSHECSIQAVSLLTRKTAGPADTFISSLARLDAASLRWVRRQIDAHLRNKEGKASGANGFASGSGYRSSSTGVAHTYGASVETTANAESIAVTGQVAPGKPGANDPRSNGHTSEGHGRRSGRGGRRYGNTVGGKDG